MFENFMLNVHVPFKLSNFCRIDYCVFSKQVHWAVVSEQDRDELRATMAMWGTLHCAEDRVSKTSGGVLLPARFSERLLVLAAIIRARSDSTSSLATPGLLR
jgi:hypothetical protein